MKISLQTSKYISMNFEKQILRAKIEDNLFQFLSFWFFSFAYCDLFCLCLYVVFLSGHLWLAILYLTPLQWNFVLFVSKKTKNKYSANLSFWYKSPSSSMTVTRLELLEVLVHEGQNVKRLGKTRVYGNCAKVVHHKVVEPLLSSIKCFNKN